MSQSVVTGLIVGGSIAGFLLLLFIFIKRFLYICNPNEILIFSGRKRRTGGGQSVGYRVIFGGRVVKIPIVESVDRMDMTVMPILVEVHNAYSKGGIPLAIQTIANVKISSKPELTQNAIERFLGRDRSEISRVAKETLEGNLRGVLAMMTPEQVNEDRLEFADRMAKDVSRDLAKLGLQLDTLKIQSVADDVDYLNSLGRKEIALIIRNAEIAESDALREAETVVADARRQGEVAQTNARAAILKKENELRHIVADLDKDASSEEERTTAAAAEARARAEQELQTVRMELEKLRLEADEVIPANADKQARELLAAGEAAPLAENARATAQATVMLSKAWREAGSDASEIFLIQQVEMILREAASIPGRVKLNNIHLIDSGDGSTVTGLVNAYPAIVRQFLETVKDTVGIDVVGALTNNRSGSE